MAKTFTNTIKFTNTSKQRPTRATPCTYSPLHYPTLQRCYLDSASFKYHPSCVFFFYAAFARKLAAVYFHIAALKHPTQQQWIAWKLWKIKILSKWEEWEKWKVSLLDACKFNKFLSKLSSNMYIYYNFEPSLSRKNSGTALQDIGAN